MAIMCYGGHMQFGAYPSIQCTNPSCESQASTRVGIVNENGIGMQIHRLCAYHAYEAMTRIGTRMWGDRSQ